MTPDQAEAALEKAFDAYLRRVSAIAGKAQRETVNPWLRANGRTMRCGNGDWFISGVDNVFAEGEPFDLLNVSVPGFRGNDLGSFMDNVEN